MKKVYRYSRFYYIGLLLVGLIGFILAKGFLYEAFPVENYAVSIFFALLALLIIAGFVQYWRSITMKIITDSDTIIISKPFKSVKYRWEEISEFGKFRRVAPYVGGYWVYYLKGGLRNRKSVLEVRGLKNFEDLVPYILLGHPSF